MSDWNPDPKLYRQLSLPYPSQAEASAALSAFYEDVRIAREKHKIANVYLAVSANWLDAEGEESAAYSTGGFGDQMEHEAMCAYALGTIQTERQARIAKLLAAGGVKRGPRA